MALNMKFPTLEYMNFFNEEEKQLSYSKQIHKHGIYAIFEGQVIRL